MSKSSAILKGRRNTGMTLVELLVVCGILTLLGAIATGQYYHAENKARLAAVKGNMHTAQVASELYAVVHHDHYAATPDELYPFYPQGANTDGGAYGKKPQNPFTNALDEPLYEETITDIPTMFDARNNPPTGAPGTPGQVGFSSLESRMSYCITGADEDSNRLAGPNGTLVLSNQ